MPPEYVLAARLGGVGETEALEHLAATAPSFGLRQVVEPPDELQVLETCEVLVDRRALSGEPDAETQLLGVAHDVEAVDLCPPGRRRQQGRQYPHARGLAGPVRSEQAEHRALVHLEVDAFQRLDLAEVLDELFGADDGRGHGPSG